MKKKLRKEISELAAELANTSSNFDVAAIKVQLQYLNDKLTVLQYLEGQLEATDESVDSKSFREQNWFTEPEQLPQPENKEEIVEPLMEKIKDLVAQMPEESQQVDELLEEVLPKQKYVKNDLEEFASNYKEMPVFERKDAETTLKTTTVKETVSNETVDADKPRSLNETVNTGLNIGLNDRIAFIKHLFNDSTDDYARVLSQIETMQSFEQAESFIKGKVKPDYNYWLNKDEYTERFMQIVEKRFN